MYTTHLLSLAAIASASASDQNVRPSNDRSLQASMTCILQGETFGTPDCCPSPSEDDGICTLLWCVDTAKANIRDGCTCGQINTACGQLTKLPAMISGISGPLCDQADTCCIDGATNEDSNACMAMPIADGTLQVRDFSAMLGGSLPVLDLSVLGGGGDNNVTEAPTDTSEETSEEVDNGNDTAGTTAGEPGGDGNLGLDGGNDANKYAISTLMTLIGASLPILFV